MKIAIPVDENKESVCIVFARAPYFFLYDTDSDKKETVENTAANEQSGAGIKAAQLVADLGIDLLITVRLGENSAEVLEAANIKIYKSCPGTAEENIEAFKNGTLSRLTEFHAGFHGKA